MRIHVLGGDGIDPHARTYAEHRVRAALMRRRDMEAIRDARVVLHRPDAADACSSVACAVTVSVDGSEPLRVLTVGGHPYAAVNRAVEHLDMTARRGPSGGHVQAARAREAAASR